MTVNQVSRLTGVSARTLQYYDKIGLLKPTGYTKSGYRLYGNGALERLQQILLFRELEFSLKEIKKILSNPDFNRDKALEQQINLLTMKKERLEHLISFAREIKLTGVRTMDFSVFDTKKMDEYAKRAREQWGDSPEYQEYQRKFQGRGAEEERAVMENFWKIFVEFGAMKQSEPGCEAAKKQVKKLQDFISGNFYSCSPEILSSLGQMYRSGGEFTQNIDRVAGEGTAAFTAEAIRIYCSGSCIS